MLGLQALHPDALVGSRQLGFGQLRQPRVVGGMAVAQHLGLSSGGQPASSVVADTLQQPVAGLLGGGVGNH